MRVGGITDTSRKEWLGHSQETLNFRGPRKHTRQPVAVSETAQNRTHAIMRQGKKTAQAYPSTSGVRGSRGPGTRERGGRRE